MRFVQEEYVRKTNIRRPRDYGRDGDLDDAGNKKSDDESLWTLLGSRKQAREERSQKIDLESKYKRKMQDQQVLTMLRWGSRRERGCVDQEAMSAQTGKSACV